jgi:hypothetical protein
MEEAIATSPLERQRTESRFWDLRRMKPLSEPPLSRLEDERLIAQSLSSYLTSIYLFRTFVESQKTICFVELSP